MEVVELFPSRCAICHTEGNVIELYAANFDPQALNPVVFSARRLPDRIHYRIVRCKACGLVRSDPIAALGVLARLYSQSTFDYVDEVVNIQRTYGHYLAKLTNDYGAEKGALLEIGCGNGFFLEEALLQGYISVRGVEPSIEAIAKSSLQVRSNIICDIFRPKMFKPDQFDVICMFQLLDHLANPNIVLDECFRVLKPGGLVLCLNHNVDAILARYLKDRSPIIDIEHTYFYSPTTISHIFAGRGFRVLHVGAVCNIYTVYYLVRLAPLPDTLKRIFLALLNSSLIGRIRLSVQLGNLYIVAQKPG